MLRTTSQTLRRENSNTKAKAQIANLTKLVVAFFARTMGVQDLITGKFSGCVIQALPPISTTGSIICHARPWQKTFLTATMVVAALSSHNKRCFVSVLLACNLIRHILMYPQTCAKKLGWPRVLYKTIHVDGYVWISLLA